MKHREKLIGGLGATRYGWTLASPKCTPYLPSPFAISALAYAGTSATLASKINFTRRWVLVLFI
jgi:hypothetical protein